MTASLWTTRIGEGTRQTRVTAQEVKQYLADIGIDVEIDFESERLWVVCVRRPIFGAAVPKREDGLWLEPGDEITL